MWTNNVLKVCLGAALLALTASVFQAATTPDKDPGVMNDIRNAHIYSTSDPAKSIYFANEAIKAAEKAGDKELVAQSQSELANTYINQGDFVTAFEVLTDALGNCPPDNDKLLSAIYSNLSFIYTRIKEFDKALDYATRSVPLFEKLKDTVGLAICYNSVGLVYVQVPDNAKAESYFLKALDLNKKISNMTGVAQTLNNLSLYEGDCALKIDGLKTAIAINDSLGRIWMLGENHNNLGAQYYYAKDYTEALAALVEARRYAEEVNAQDLVLDNDRYLSWVYAATGDYKQAYLYQKSLLDKTEGSNLTGKTAAVEMRLLNRNLSNSEKEKELARKEFDINRKKMTMLIVFFSLLCIVLLVLFWILRYNHRKKLQLLESQEKLDTQEKALIQKELDCKRTELSDFALYVKSRNDILERIREELKKSQKLPDDERQSSIRSIIASISQFTPKNDETDLMIDNLNSEFIGRLNDKHSGLTKSEQRLASLLRIGMSSKEISLILSVESKSVDMARYRLRKKMDLNSDDDLVSYLGKI